MSLIVKEFIDTGSQLGIWKKEEDLELLLSVYPLVPSEKESFEKINNLSRKNEWLTTRILLTELLEKRKIIQYTAHGKPFLNESNLHISITHSKHFVSILVSENYIPGIDVEHISMRVNKVTHKFLSETEMVWCNNLTLMTACWSAKEAIFKVFGKDLDFKDIEINPFTIEQNKGSLSAKIIKNDFTTDFALNYHLIENDILVYTLKTSDAY
ncbi:MAG: 4'-phosphopantetheinyl transferase superfamily protein [Salinivirgaceae bacterium]|jgi:phosphopantetheinyl transferase